MALILAEIAIEDGTYSIESNTLNCEAESMAKRSAKRTGLVTGIGALTGGKKGAGIGAVISAGVGSGTPLITAGAQVEFPVERLFDFTLGEDFEMKIQK